MSTQGVDIKAHAAGVDAVKELAGLLLQIPLLILLFYTLF